MRYAGRIEKKLMERDGANLSPQKKLTHVNHPRSWSETKTTEGASWASRIKENLPSPCRNGSEVVMARSCGPIPSKRR